MKKLIFLSLILWSLPLYCFIEKSNLEPQIITNRKKELKKAIKKRDLTLVIRLIKTLSDPKELSTVFSDPLLLTLAFKKFKNNQACRNDSGFFEELLYALIPAGFIFPYALFYYTYKDIPTPLLIPRINFILKGATAASGFLALLASLSCVYIRVAKARACKESKLIYKILRNCYVAEQLGEIYA